MMRVFASSNDFPRQSLYRRNGGISCIATSHILKKPVKKAESAGFHEKSAQNAGNDYKHTKFIWKKQFMMFSIITTQSFCGNKYI